MIVPRGHDDCCCCGFDFAHSSVPEDSIGNLARNATSVILIAALVACFVVWFTETTTLDVGMSGLACRGSQQCVQPGVPPKNSPLNASLFPSRPVIVVGDVHGCLSELRHLLDRIGFNWRARLGERHRPPSTTVEDGIGPEFRDARLVFVGDLVAKGPSSLGVVKFIRTIGEIGCLGVSKQL